MIQPNQFFEIIGASFFGGNTEIGGLVVFVIILALIFGFTRNVFQTLVIALPVTFLFSGSGFGVLPTDLVLLLIVVIVLGLALSSKKALSR